MQERHIKNLEKVLDKARSSHEQLRNRVEAVELDSIKLRESLLGVGPGGTVMLGETHKMSGTKSSKVRIMRSIRNDARKHTHRFHGGETPFSREKTPAVGNNMDTPSSQQRLHTETESHELSDNRKGIVYHILKHELICFAV